MKCLILLVAVLGCSLAAPAPQYNQYNQYNQGRYNPYNQYNRFNPYNQNQYRQQYYSSTFKPFVTSSTAAASVTPVAAEAVSSTALLGVDSSLPPVVASRVSPNSFVDGKHYNYHVSNDQNAQTLRFDNDASPEGAFQYSFETSNGIAAQAVGSPRSLGDSQPTIIQGSYSWVSPEGKVISISYVADENGYRAVGDSIPTPPPIPAAILRSIEFNRQHNHE